MQETKSDFIRAPKKNTSHGNEVLLQHTMHLVQRPCHRRGSLCQDPAGNQTTRRPPDHCKEMQTAVVWSCLLFIRSGQSYLARHSARGKTTRQAEEEVGIQHQGMDRHRVHQVQEGSGEQGKKWRKLVVKWTVVPQRLRDRLCMCACMYVCMFGNQQFWGFFAKLSLSCLADFE